MRKRTVRRQWITRSPIDIAIGRAVRMPKREVDAQMLPLLTSIERLVTGRWLAPDWGAVRDAANRIEILMRQRKLADPEFLPQVGAVIDAALQRFAADGTKALRHEEAEVLHWLAESYDTVLNQATRGQFMDACTTSERLVAQIQAERRNKAKKEAAAC